MRWLAFLVLVACAPKTGWERTTSRVCEPKAPATVCLEATPDRAVEGRVGGETILPGECAVSPKRGGRVKMELRENGARDHVGVHAPKSKRTRVTLEPHGKKPQISRDRCDQRP